MFRSDNNTNLLIGLDIARTANVQINDRSNATTYLADGEIVVLGSDDAVLPAGSTYGDSNSIRIVQRSGATASTSELISSVRIDGANVVSYTGRSYQAPQTQQYFIGYDGAASSIDAIDSNDYALRIQYKHDKELWSQRTRIKSYYYTSGTVATQERIAREFAVLIGNDTDADVTVERLCNNAAAAPVGVPTLTVTNGSRSATLSAASASIVAGIYLRIGTVATLTDPVYRVTSVSGTTVTLDQAFEGTSATGVVIGFITAALATAATFGLRLTGETLTFTVGKFKYNVVTFDLALSGFGDTVTNESREASFGNGTYEQIAQLEYFAQGFDGIIDRIGDTAPTLRSDATVAETYDVISIEGFDTSDSHIISGTKPSKNQCLLAIPDGAGQANNILAQLNPWMASLPRTFSNVAI